MYYQTLFVISCFVLSDAEEYQNSFLKLLNRNSDSVIDVTSASVVIQPSRLTNQYSREADIPYAYRRYAFKPRAIPISDESQVESGNYYPEALNKTKLLFPGNYLPIDKENSDIPDDQFHIKQIPLIRSDEFQKRSLDVDEPIIQKPEDFSEESLTRRSLSYIFGVDGNDDDDYEEYEEEDIKDEERKKGSYINKLKKKKPKKLKKYMLPLLLAYKMKYFALVPSLIAGLLLLVGATGLAGFFFALFAAAMGLQKGGY